MCSRRAIVLSVLLLAACKESPRLGPGFEGAITMQTTRGSEAPKDTVVRVRGDRMRYETPDTDGSTASAIYLPDPARLELLFGGAQTTMEIPLTPLNGPLDTRPVPSAVSWTGETQTVDGIACETVNVHDSGGRHTEACVVRGIPFHDIAAIRGPDGETGWMREMREKKMFPLRTVVRDAGGSVLSTSTVVSIASGPVDDSVFAVPSSYRRVGRPVR